MPKRKKLEKGLKRRHIQMMAIGGAIGTGLFLGSGKSLHLAGPSVLLAYFVTGIICFFIMRALGELLLSDLRHSSFVGLIRAYFGERWAFVTAWTYWFCWACIAMADLTAIGIYIQYWFPSVPQWIPGFFALLLLLGMNLVTVKLFGEIEFWFALVKVIAIVGLIVLGIVMLLFHYQTPGGHEVSLSNLWKDHFFGNGFFNYLLAFQMVVFSFVGIEMVGITVAEMQNPEVALRKSINAVPIRILIFYIGALTAIMSVIPWREINPNESPFVAVFSIAGIASAATVINLVVLASAGSACNSGIYSTSRILFNMGRRHEAPRAFSKLNPRNIPARSLLFSALIIFIAVLLNYIMPKGVFTLITSISTSCFLYVWGIIVLCHWRYRHQLVKNRLPEGARAVPNFRMPLFPITNVIILAFLVFVAVVLILAPDTRVAMLVAPVWILFLVLAFQVKQLFRPDEKMGLEDEATKVAPDTGCF